MHDARDALDADLIAAGDLATLLATWLPTVRTRVHAVVRDASADDVVQEVMLRLYRELAAGKRYTVPFRVVLHNVITWLVGNHLRRKDVRLVSFDEELDPGVELELELRDELEAWLGVLTAPQREVFELRCFGDLSAREVAARLGMAPNAVDQTYDRAKRRLREAVGNG